MLVGVHKLLRFEKLPAAVSVLGLDPHLMTHRNSSKKMAQRAGIEFRPLLDYYDRTAYDAITQRYARDLDELKYDYPGDIPGEGKADGAEAKSALQAAAEPDARLETGMVSHAEAQP
jgi:hypothetical protein